MKAECPVDQTLSLEEQLQETRLNLIHASRLALTGQLLASIVHEIQQPLMAVRLRAVAGRSGLEKRSLTLKDMHRILRDIEDSVDFAAEIIEQLKALSSKQPFDMQSIDLNEALCEVLQLANIEAKMRDVSIEFHSIALPRLAADRVSLKQAVLDLIVNAIEAVADTKDRHVVVSSHLLDQEIELQISDTGPGISPAHHNQLFQTFFTTKIGGTGLGLAIAKSIVEAHGGRIWADKDPGPGASFRIRLPLASAH